MSRRKWHVRRMFQFTHPGKGATSQMLLGLCCKIVSIHAPWEGCDQSVLTK